MEQQGETVEKEVPMGPGGVPQGAKTSDYYRVNNIPHRFDNPGISYNMGNPVFTCSANGPPPDTNSADCFEKYPEQSPHPMYRTTSQQYGKLKPTVHDMPKCFYAKSQKFSEHLGGCGMYRNYSLNTAIDSSKV